MSTKQELIEELIAFFVQEGFPVYGAIGIEGTKPPPFIENQGFGDGRKRQPDVVGIDRANERIVFGLARPDRMSLDSEVSLTEYNLFLDHHWDYGSKASMLYVLMPGELLVDFTAIVTHYVHREYWHRVVPIASGRREKSTEDTAA
ncbi:MAG: hypothetical protein ACKVRP_09690 [Bacteroidota bacterium]